MCKRLFSLVLLLIAATVLAEAPTSRPVVSERLAMRLAEVNLEGRTLRQVVTDITGQAGLNLVIPGGQLAHGEEKLKGKLTNVTVKMALNHAFLEATGSTPRLQYSDVDGPILRLNGDGQTELRAYNISPLFRLLAKEAGPGGGQVDATETMDNIAKLIETTIDPASWRSAGGTEGSMFLIGGRLVIVQTPENHRAIAALLVRLEQARGK